jgi:protein gp37
VKTETEAFKKIFSKGNSSEVFDQVLRDSHIEEEFTIADFVPKYTYQILELNTEYKNLLKDFSETTTKLKQLQSNL